MRATQRQWIRHYFVWIILCGLSVVMLAACSTSGTTGPSVKQSTPSPVKVVRSPQPTIVPSLTKSSSSASCSGYKYEAICIIDPQHILGAQQPAHDAIAPMINDMAMTIASGTVLVSQKYGVLDLTLTDEGGSGNDKEFCRSLIFSAFYVTEYDYPFPSTSITCHANQTTLSATLSKNTAKKINWDTSLTVNEEAAIAWDQYDSHYETT